MIVATIVDVPIVREVSVTVVNYAKTYTAILLCVETILIIVETIDYKIPIKIGVLVGYQVQDMIDIGNGYCMQTIQKVLHTIQKKYGGQQPEWRNPK